MNNLELLKVFKGIQELDCKSSYQVMIKSIEIVDFKEFKKVHAE
jgi:hypothetical protein